jgi:hypothetical protein
MVDVQIYTEVCLEDLKARHYLEDCVNGKQMEPWSSIEGGKFLYNLSNYFLLNKGLTPWS